MTAWLLPLLVAQGITVNTPEGSISITITESESRPEESTTEVTSGTILANIHARLERLEKLVKDREFAHRREAVRLIGEIRGLLALLPEETDIRITPVEGNEEEPREEEPAPVLNPISESSLQTLIQDLREEPFSDDQLRLLRTAADKHHFTVDQVLRILPVFTFEDDRVEAVRILWPKVLDKENGHRLYSAFTFSDSKEKVEQIIR